MILAVAQSLRDRPDTRVVVVSEGPSAQWLAEQAGAQGLETLKVLPFQPYEHYSDVLGSAKVLISVLEKDAGTFSVPSKILSYLCSGRAIVLSAPPENLSSKIVQRANAGATTTPGDTAGFIAAIGSLLDDPARQAECAKNGRGYAEQKFDVRAIATRFERIFASVLGGEKRAEQPLSRQVESEIASR
jgi:colanic acid biosynthesis glycosyl transferase WcaI